MRKKVTLTEEELDYLSEQVLTDYCRVVGELETSRLNLDPRTYQGDLCNMLEYNTIISHLEYKKILYMELYRKLTGVKLEK